MRRRDFIKGLIRCVPAIVVPKLIFDLSPTPVGYFTPSSVVGVGPPLFSDLMYPRRFDMLGRPVEPLLGTKINPAYESAHYEEIIWSARSGFEIRRG